MRKAAVDTNILLRLVLDDVPEQTRLAEELIQRPGTRFVISDTAVIELTFALDRHYHFSRSQIGAVVQALAMINNLDINEVFESIVPVYAAHPKLSFTDCYLAQCAEQADSIPLWTLDRKLANQHGAARLLTAAALEVPAD